MPDILQSEQALIDALIHGKPDQAAVADVADWLGLSTSRVYALASQGVLPRGEDGRFPLKAAVQAYCAHARAGALGRRAEPELAGQKLRLARENADKLALQNAASRGELLDARAVATEWRGIVTDLRAAILAVPSRVAATLGLDRAATLALDAEVRAALEAIADDR